MRRHGNNEEGKGAAQKGFETRGCRYFMWSTSSTAQGGGGSFKNRKPIGEVGGCESGMAERSH